MTQGDAQSAASANAAGRELVITRVFDAPRDLVWRAWTDPRHVAQWWGPAAFTNPVCDLYVRPGGAILIHMRGPDGVVYPMTGVFHEVVPPERLVMTTAAFVDASGVAGLEVILAVTFVEREGQTELTLRALVAKAAPEAAGALDGMEQGWNQSLDRLAEHLAVDGAVSMTDDGAQAYPQAPEPSPDLRRLDRLVGTWEQSGGVQGRVTFEWMEGGYFLLQRVDLEHDGRSISGIEVIGHARPFMAEPSAEITSRFYSNTGDTLDYVYELEGDTLTIWGGERGSPAYYRGTFSEDGDTLTGGWVYPGGGGYEATTTRIK